MSEEEGVNLKQVSHSLTIYNIIPPVPSMFSSKQST